MLIIRENTLQWHHLDYDAVGRGGGANDPTWISTWIDGVPVLSDFPWTPEWSAPPPDSIQQEEFSSTFLELMPALPSSPISISLTPVQARSSLEVAEIPTQANDYAIVVDFNDNGPGGKAWHEVLLKITDPVLGNMDLDGDADFDDIPPFVLGINEPATYESTFGVPPSLNGDTDGDRDFDFDDMPGFVDLLGGVTAVPEPASLLLVLAGIAGLVGVRRRSCTQWRQTQ